MTIAAARQFSPSSLNRGLRTQGHSVEAGYVVNGIAEGLAKLRKSNSLGAGVEAATQELNEIAEQCNVPGWDGYEAAPIEQATYRLAAQFLNSLPLGNAVPSVGAEPDGHITFEWHQSPRRTLSVSVSPTGELHYAAMLGFRNVHGTEFFFGEIPTDILNLAQRVYAE